VGEAFSLDSAVEPRLLWLSRLIAAGKPLHKKAYLLRKTNSRMGILDTWNRYREAKKNQRQKESDLIDLIECMVQDSDPSIRKLAGYRKQLKQPVENALGHIEGLISSIPGPFSLSADVWDKDPLNHALFVSPDEIRSLLQNCVDLKSFFQQSGSEDRRGFAYGDKKATNGFRNGPRG